jgi:hypothetical protein
MDDGLSPAWRAIARLQASIANNRFVNGDSFADEEALADLIDEFKESEPTLEKLGRRHFSLLKNRRRKHRCRRRLRRAWLADTGRRPETAPSAPSEYVGEVREELREVELNLDSADWRFFLRIAEGESIATLAKEAGVSAGAMRVRLHRRRQELLQAVA